MGPTLPPSASPDKRGRPGGRRPPVRIGDSVFHSARPRDQPAAGPRASRGLRASPVRPGGSELPPVRPCDALAPPAASLPAAWASLEGFGSSTLDERGRESRTPGPPPPRPLRRHDRQVSSSSRPCGNGPGARSARPLIAWLGGGRWPGAAGAAPPGRSAPRGRGGVCAPAPPARAAPRGDAPVRRAHRLTLPPPSPPLGPRRLRSPPVHASTGLALPSVAGPPPPPRRPVPRGALDRWMAGGSVVGTVPIVKGLVLRGASRDIASLVPGPVGEWGTRLGGLVSASGSVGLGTVPIVEGLVLRGASRDVASLVPGPVGAWGSTRQRDTGRSGEGCEADAKGSVPISGRERGPVLVVSLDGVSGSGGEGGGGRGGRRRGRGWPGESRVEATLKCDRGRHRRGRGRQRFRGSRRR